VGRALRPELGKRRAIILDHVGNVVRHGLPCEDREWSLDGHRGSEASEESGPSLRSCEKCFAVYPPELGRCPDCGWEPEAREADLPEEVEGELEEVDPAVIRRQRKMEEAQAQGIRALVLLARERGYKPGWAAHRHAARTKMPVHAAKAKEMEIRRELRMRHSPERQEQLR
jgi:DNA repair protein RadD